MILTEAQLDELETRIRRTIAEDDRDVSECCKCGASDLTAEGIDHLARMARCEIEAFIATEDEQKATQ